MVRRDATGDRKSDRRSPQSFVAPERNLAMRDRLSRRKNRTPRMGTSETAAKHGAGGRNLFGTTRSAKIPGLPRRIAPMTDSFQATKSEKRPVIASAGILRGRRRRKTD